MRRGRQLRRASRWLALAVPLTLPWRCRLDDLGAYWAWGQALAAGAWPYRDFAFEYPPLALVAIALPASLANDSGAYVALFTLGLALLDGATRLGAMPRRCSNLAGLALGTLLQLPLYAVALRRLDGVAVAAATWALHLLVRRPRGLAAWGVLGLGVGIKLYPALLLPPMAVYARRRGAGWPRLAAGLALASAGLLVPTALAAWGAGPQALQWASYHHQRGLHGATSYVAWHWLRAGLGTPVATAFCFGTQQVTEPWAVQALAWAPVWMALSLGVTLVATLPRVRDAIGLYRASLALVMALLLTAKVFSPQYVLWLLPLGLAAARPRGGTHWPLLAGLFAVAALTGMIYPGETLMLAGQARRQAALMARTAVLVGLWLYLVVSPRLPAQAGAAVSLTASRRSAQTPMA